jgi:hypothetical protein
MMMFVTDVAEGQCFLWRRCGVAVALLWRIALEPHFRRANLPHASPLRLNIQVSTRMHQNLRINVSLPSLLPFDGHGNVIQSMKSSSESESKADGRSSHVIPSGPYFSAVVIVFSISLPVMIDRVNSLSMLTRLIGCLLNLMPSCAFSVGEAEREGPPGLLRRRHSHHFSLTSGFPVMFTG